MDKTLGMDEVRPEDQEQIPGQESMTLDQITAELGSMPESSVTAPSAAAVMEVLEESDPDDMSDFSDSEKNDAIATAIANAKQAMAGVDAIIPAGVVGPSVEAAPFTGLVLSVGDRIFSSRGEELGMLGARGIIPTLKLYSDSRPNLKAELEAARLQLQPRLHSLSFTHKDADGLTRLYGLLFPTPTGFKRVRWRGLHTLQGGPGTLKTTLFAAVKRRTSDAYTQDGVASCRLSKLGEHDALSFGRDIPDFLEDVTSMSLLDDPSRAPEDLLLFDGASGVASATVAGYGAEGTSALVYNLLRSLSAWADLSLLGIAATFNVPVSTRSKEAQGSKIESSLDTLTQIYSHAELAKSKLAVQSPFAGQCLRAAAYPKDVMTAYAVHRRRAWAHRYPAMIVLPKIAKLWELIERRGVGAWTGPFEDEESETIFGDAKTQAMQMAAMDDGQNVLSLEMPNDEGDGPVVKNQRSLIV